MNEFDALRRVLNSKALAAANYANLDGRIALPNENFTPPVKLIYAEFWYKTGGSKQIELGGAGSMEMTVGIFQFDILAPEHTGDGPAVLAGDLIRKRWNRKEWLAEPDGNIKIVACNVKTPFAGPQAGYYRVCVDGVFHYYHRDPNALPFDA